MGLLIGSSRRQSVGFLNPRSGYYFLVTTTIGRDPGVGLNRNNARLLQVIGRSPLSNSLAAREPDIETLGSLDHHQRNRPTKLRSSR